VLSNGRRYLGTIVSSTPDSVVLSIDGGTVEFPRSIVQSPPYLGPVEPAGETAPESKPAPHATISDPLPGVVDALSKVALFSWGRQVRQVPVLVTDKGRWQFLPCVSFWLGDFFQLSFYGDPAHPAVIEASLHRPPADAWGQKRQILEYMLSLVPGLAVDKRFDKLDVHGDSFTVGDLWFEVNDTDSPRSPDRWSVLLLHELSLSPARASYDELEAISEPVPVAVIDPTQPRSWQKGSWTPDELAWLHEAPIASPQVQPGAAPMSGNGAPPPPPPQSWSSVGGERIYVRSFTREHGRYARSDTEWLRNVAVNAAP
jgi:hypothetical protein